MMGLFAKLPFLKPEPVPFHVQMYQSWERAVCYDFNESEHPRAADGTFAEKSGGEVIGKGSTGEVRRVGSNVHKNAVGAEGAVYRELGGKNGIAPGKEVSGDIVTPFFKNVVSVDTVPEGKRASMGAVLKPNLGRLVAAITALSESGYSYDDPIQVGFDDKRQAHLFDFSAASKVEPNDAVVANLVLLGSYLGTFGLSRYGDGLKAVASVWNYATNDDSRAFASDEDDAKAAEAIVGNLDGNPPRHAYFTYNQRTIKGVPQGDYAGVKIVLTHEPLSDEFMREWELSPAIHKDGE